MNIKNQQSTAVADGLQRGSGLRRIACLAALLVVFAVGARAADYGLYICGVQVTDDNKNSLSDLPGVKQGTITFDGTNLTLDGVSIDVTGKTAQGMTLGQSGLTLTLVGSNSIKGDYAGIKVTANATITGSGSLDIDAKQQGILGDARATLTINGGCHINANSQGYGVTGQYLSVTISNAATVLSAYGTLGSISDVSSLLYKVKDGLKLVEPKGAKVSSGSVVDENGNVVKGQTVTICKPIAIDATNFPDDIFREYVSSNCDADKDTYLSANEIAAVTRIDVSTKSISSLKGIEYFTALTVLYCDNNKLTSLAVSKNTALTRLDCYFNQLTSLDLSNNTALTYLSCHDNPLISLDVSKNTALTTLNCGGSPYSAALLTSLDVSKNTALTYLNCQDNLLTSLDVSGCTALKVLICYGNQLTSLDVSNNTALTELYCSNNQLTSLDVSKNTKNTALTRLLCYNNQIQGAGMAKLVNSLLEVTNGKFYVYNTDGTEGNEITTVQVAAAKKNGWSVLTSNGDDYAGVDPGIAIDATNFPDENFREYVSSNCDTDKDTYLSDDEIAAVTSIDVSWKQKITSLEGIEYFTALTELRCYDNQLTFLDVSKNTALTFLGCGYNQLTSLDVSKNTALTVLYCYYNQLTSLDVSKNTALTWLTCNHNQLASLVVSKNAALTVLSCSDNQLTSLDVSKNTALTYLACSSNQLTSLDVSKNTALEELYCGWNHLTSLDVSKNRVLTRLIITYNQIRGAGMAKLVNSLLEVTNGKFYVTDGTDGNRITTVQVAAAEKKGWGVLTDVGDDYPGVNIPGDANGDGEVNAQDVDCLRSYILGLDPTPFSLESANLNGDGAVDIADLTLLIQLLTE